MLYMELPGQTQYNKKEAVRILPSSPCVVEAIAKEFRTWEDGIPLSCQPVLVPGAAIL